MINIQKREVEKKNHSNIKKLLEKEKKITNKVSFNITIPIEYQS